MASAKPTAPAPIQNELKKETARLAAVVPPSKASMPQATVQMQKKPDPSKSVATTAITVAPTASENSSAELSPILGVAALVVALLALGVQVMMYLG